MWFSYLGFSPIRMSNATALFCLDIALSVVSLYLSHLLSLYHLVSTDGCKKKLSRQHMQRLTQMWRMRALWWWSRRRRTWFLLWGCVRGRWLAFHLDHPNSPLKIKHTSFHVLHCQDKYAWVYSHRKVWSLNLKDTQVYVMFVYFSLHLIFNLSYL